MRIAHVITGLGAGGTPVMLHKVLASQRSFPEIESMVVGMIGDGPIGHQIRELGVPVVTLGMQPGVPDPRSLWRLKNVLREFQPDLIQSWLYHADLWSSLVSPVVGFPPVVWNLRHATLDPKHDGRSTRWTAKLCAWLSKHSPSRILVNTVSGRHVHERYGYDSSKMLVVPNGFDLDRFRPDPVARAAIRRELRFADSTPVVGLIARYSPLKNQELFIESMSRLVDHVPEVQFVLCGYRISADNEPLLHSIQTSGHSERFHLLGERLDIERIHTALDLEVSSSRSEAFSNSIGEAMCCGVPCVVTDVGDSAWIVDDPLLVVPSEDATSLSATCRKLLTASVNERRLLASKVRERMEQMFDIHVVARQYRDIWKEILDTQATPTEVRSASPTNSNHSSSTRRAA